MAHATQALFFHWVKELYPSYFKGKRVLDVGSLNVNGCNKILFTDCDYVGVDIGPGENVDVVCKAHEYDAPAESFDVVISSECFEHDMYIKQTLNKITDLLKPEGLFVFTCASETRPEHGTTRTDPNASPLTSKVEGWCDYYKGLSEQDIRSMLNLGQFTYEFHRLEDDLYFVGVKDWGENDVPRHSQRTFEQFVKGSSVSRISEVPYQMVKGRVKGTNQDSWFLWSDQGLIPVEHAIRSTPPIPMHLVELQHAGDLLLKEDIGTYDMLKWWNEDRTRTGGT